MRCAADDPQACVVTVALPREVDFTNAQQLCAALCIQAPGATVVVADMTATRFCDSTGFRMLLAVHDRLAEQAIEFRVALRPGGPVVRALKLTGFDQILRLSLTAAGSDQQGDGQMTRSASS